MKDQMMKFVYLLKRIFIPSFTYEYYSSLPSSSYLNHVEKAIKLLECKNVRKNDNFISFYIQASKVFGLLSFGKILLNIEFVGSNRYKFGVQFLNHRSLFFTFAFILSILSIINIAKTGNLSDITVLPTIFLSGHIIFWGMLPAKVRKIRQFFFNLDES